MSCEQMQRDLDAYVDHELDTESAVAMREHVDTCPDCRRDVAEREALGRLVRAAPYFPAPDRLRARRYSDPRTSRGRRRGRRG